MSEVRIDFMVIQVGGLLKKSQEGVRQVSGSCVRVQDAQLRIGTLRKETKAIKDEDSDTGTAGFSRFIHHCNE